MVDWLVNQEERRCDEWKWYECAGMLHLCIDVNRSQCMDVMCYACIRTRIHMIHMGGRTVRRERKDDGGKTHRIVGILCGLDGQAEQLLRSLSADQRPKVSFFFLVLCHDGGCTSSSVTGRSGFGSRLLQVGGEGKPRVRNTNVRISQVGG